MFTCNTCSLAFPGHEDQRVHMKSDWHRYNLKRRVAQLPAIDEDLFTSKIASLTIQDEGEEAVQGKKKGEKQLTKKEQRRREKEVLQEKKRQLLESAKQAMMDKIKSGEITQEQLRELETERNLKNKVKEDEAEGKISAAVKEAVVPPAEGTQDASVLEKEGETTSESKVDTEVSEEQFQENLIKEKFANRVEIPPTTCLFSHPKENKHFETVEENVEHMWKTYGLYIPEKKYLVDLPGLISYLGEKISFGFCIACNYQGRNAEAAREHMKQKRHMRIPYEDEDEKLEISAYYDFSSTYEDVSGSADAGEWEDVSGDEDDEDGKSTNEEDELPVQNNIAYQNASKELILPSGTILGHRQNNKYYQQNLGPERILSEGQGTVIAAETRHMLTVKDKAELAVQKRTWARQLRSRDQFDRKAKKFINQQEHFRDPLLQ